MFKKNVQILHGDHHHSGDCHSHADKARLRIVWFAATFLVFMATEYFAELFGFSQFASNFNFLAFTFLALTGLMPIFKKAWQYMRGHYIFSIETLLCIAVTGAIFINAPAEAAAVVILFMIGEALESYTAGKAQEGIKSLAALVPEEAFILNSEGDSKKVKVTDISVGDFVEVKPGERLPVDGLIFKGTSYIDESLLTGESLPLQKKEGDKVIAGSISTDGLIVVEATGVGSDNSVARMIKLVENAHSSKSKITRSIEKFSRVYTPIILAVCVFVAIIPPLFFSLPWTEWIYRSLAILLIGCPCALIISTPSAIAAGITAATKLGILVKQASAIEMIGRIKNIAFDKTGTITVGKLQVTDVISFTTGKESLRDEILRIAASVEAKSTHPLARAIADFAAAEDLSLYKVTNAKTFSGRAVRGDIDGKEVTVCSPHHAVELNLLTTEERQKITNIQKQGKTVSVVTLENVAVGIIALQDKLKDGAEKYLQQLKNLGIKNVILTGDNATSAHAVAGKLNTEIKAEMLPAQKLEYIQNISKKETIAMVGDGINDAPALAAADVGIAMGEGTDVAVDTAQIVLSKNNISAVLDTVLLSRKIMNNIKQNITLALGLKLIFLILTLLGSTQLWMAVMADTGATVLVTLNAMRLLNFKGVARVSAVFPI